jgi:hypothetical protein
MVMGSSRNASMTKNSTNGIEPISAPKIRKLVLCVKKLGGSDMDKFNPCGDQVTHFMNWMESPNVANSIYDRKKMDTTSKIWTTICVSSESERKNQVRWVIIVGQRVWRRVKANNTPPKRFPCCLLNSNEMIMKSSCWKTYKKYNGDGHA